MSILAVVFWACACAVLYAYAGYPLVLIALAGLKQVLSDLKQVWRRSSRRVQDGGEAPRVAVLVAAHDEEVHIAQRIENILSQDYPAERLRIYVGSDGSTDRTAEIAGGFRDPRLVFVQFERRRGKPSVLNDLAAMADADVLVFTDANTVFDRDAVRMLVRHFGQPGIGCVCGELRLVAPGADAANQDHVYWRYERVLKFFESRIGALLGANGGVYALRRRDYRPIPPDAIVDDFWISMQVVEVGGRCVYDPEAIATEVTPERIDDEFRRRVRIGRGNYQAMRRFAHLLDPRRGALAFAFLSHKCLRWLVPHCMLLALATNLFLLDQPLHVATLAVQLVFYGLAAAGWLRSRRGLVPRLLRLPLFFVSMNLGLLLGFAKFLQGGASGMWARSAR